MNNYSILYFGFYGNTNTIQLEGKKRICSSISYWKQVGIMYLKIFLYTSAVVEYCDSPVKVDEFKKNSKARIQSGYTKSVESSLSAIHGIEFFGEYIIRIPASTVLKILKKNFGVLENTLGFKYLMKIKTGKDINIYA